MNENMADFSRTLGRCSCGGVHFFGPDGKKYASKTATQEETCTGLVRDSPISSILSHAQTFVTLTGLWREYSTNRTVFTKLHFSRRVISIAFTIATLLVALSVLVRAFPEPLQHTHRVFSGVLANATEDSVVSYLTYGNATILDKFALVTARATLSLVSCVLEYSYSTELVQWTIALAALLVAIWLATSSLSEKLALDCDNAWQRLHTTATTAAGDLLYGLVSKGHISPTSTLVDLFTYIDGVLAAGGVFAAIAGISSGHYANLQRSVHLFRLSLPGLYSAAPEATEKLSGFFNDLGSLFKRYTAVGSNFIPMAIKIAVPTATAYYLYWKIFCQTGGRGRRTTDADQSNVLPRRENESNNNPVDPPNPISNIRVDQSALFPQCPSFQHCARVQNSIIMVGNRYHGTAFRIANYAITVAHCLSKHNGHLGAWLYDPVETTYYWAPLRKAAQKAGMVPRDSIVMLDLPNTPYFLSRTALSIDTHPRSGDYCMVFSWEANQTSRQGNYAPAVGIYTLDGLVLNTQASIRKGSSGGPILSTTGIIGCINAEAERITNFGIVFDQETIRFLGSSGAGPSSRQAELSSEDPSDQMSIMTSSSTTISEVYSRILSGNTDGLTWGQKKSAMNYESTYGDPRRAVPLDNSLWDFIQQWAESKIPTEKEKQEIEEWMRSKRNDRQRKEDDRNPNAPPNQHQPPGFESGDKKCCPKK